jgi:hypothetical protein
MYDNINTVCANEKASFFSGLDMILREANIMISERCSCMENGLFCSGYKEVIRKIRKCELYDLLRSIK